MKNIAIIGMILTLVFISGCTNRNDAERTLKAENYKNIQITGYDFFACSKDDFYHTGFRATNKDGKIVEGTVCSGILMKGVIRY